MSILAPLTASTARDKTFSLTLPSGETLVRALGQARGGGLLNVDNCFDSTSCDGEYVTWRRQVVINIRLRGTKRGWGYSFIVFRHVHLVGAWTRVTVSVCRRIVVSRPAQQHDPTRPLLRCLLHIRHNKRDKHKEMTHRLCHPTPTPGGIGMFSP